MYQKVLVPLDKSKESERVLSTVQELLSPNGEVILLHVISTVFIGVGDTAENIALGSRRRRAERNQALAYLERVVNRVGEGSGRWRCEVAVSTSAAKGIVDFAVKEQVDLIAMYTHGRKGLAKLFKRSVTQKVQKRASTEVCVVRMSEVATGRSTQP
ncbi:MAG: universal stress protein [Dehalococcoidia bacterium]